MRLNEKLFVAFLVILLIISLGLAVPLYSIGG